MTSYLEFSFFYKEFHSIFERIESPKYVELKSNKTKKRVNLGSSILKRTSFMTPSELFVIEISKKSAILAHSAKIGTASISAKNCEILTQKTRVCFHGV
jgi:uncharacterized protein Veg